ncbi:hypothetical protein [Hyphomonas sp. UBA4494]|jgi:hypothetical protein|uniref:hypothetical protein n=1 Tax=Hyphomonas sp. UBA4494 TaxID=1946631 RepID=UPI0025C279DA|nr:hypothetical protein [Hyphomonas sp. UBA4494]
MNWLVYNVGIVATLAGCAAAYVGGQGMTVFAGAFVGTHIAVVGGWLARDKSRETGLRLFMRSACPVDTSIDPRGYSWSEAYLDQAREHVLTEGEN